MIDEDFEWDDDKAASNFAKHGVSFDDARSVFRDPFAVELVDDRDDYGEDRYILIGMSVSNVVVVVYTERNERNRIISARNAEPNERRLYHEQNQ
ncbi:MAG: BrnT family toxin [Pseudomonadota bacterium]